MTREEEPSHAITPDQEALMLAMVSDVMSAETDLKQLVRFQKHVKIIWNAGFARGKAAEWEPKEQGTNDER